MVCSCCEAFQVSRGTMTGRCRHTWNANFRLRLPRPETVSIGVGSANLTAPNGLFVGLSYTHSVAAPQFSKTKLQGSMLLSAPRIIFGAGGVF
jgi:hypothetical protein